MADEDVLEPGDEEQPEPVPPERWIPHIKTDSADYLDRPDPIYVRGEDGQIREDFAKAYAERKASGYGHTGKETPEEGVPEESK